MPQPSDDELVKNTHNMARFFTEQRQVAWVCLIGALIWGLYGVSGMPQRKDPDVPVRTALVIVPWQGTKAEQIEQLVTKKIEQALAQNQWATEIKSTTRTGVVFVQFDLDEKGKYDAGKELDDVKLKLDAIQDLPEGAGPIQYIKDFGDTSALMLTVASPPADPREVAWTADLVQGRLQQVRAEARSSGPRVAIVVSYPNSIDKAEVERPVRLVANRFFSDHLATDVKVFSGAGFTGVDFGTTLTDEEVAANTKRLTGLLLQSDEFHPDASQPAVIRDLTKTREALLAAAGDKYTYRDLDDFTETLQRSIKTIPLVSKVERSGVLDERIFLNYSQERLARYNLNPSDVTNIVKSRNLPESGAKLNALTRAVDVSTTGEFKSSDDLRGVIVAAKNDSDAGKQQNGQTTSHTTPLYLRDLVDIERGYESPPSFLNHYVRRDANGKWLRTRAVTISVQMRKGQQINQFGKLIDVNLESVKKTLPSDLLLARTSDQPLQVKDSIDLFSNSLIEALVLVVLVTWIGFWSWRTALLMLCAMPITLAITFGIIQTLGIDLQQVSIASLIIALGLLVDVPVVSGDAIERELAAGRERMQAAWLGPTKLFRTMAFATLTNIVSYLPLLLLQGDTGKFLYSLPIVIGVSLIAALLASMTFVPLISSFLLKGSKETPIEERRKKGFTGWYFRTAKKAIVHRKVCFAVTLIFLAAGAWAFTLLKPQFFPKDLQYFSYLDVWLPEDSPLSATREAATRVEKLVEQVAGEYSEHHKEKGKDKDVLESMTTFMGGGGPRFWSSATPEDKQTNYAQIIIRTTDKHATSHFLDLLQPELDKKIPGTIVDTRTLETGKPIGLPVQIRVSGEDFQRLQEQGEKLKKIFRDIPIAARVRDDWGATSIKASVEVDEDRANLAGVTNSDVSKSISAALNGTQAGTFREGDKQIPIVGQLRMEDRSQLSDLNSLYVFASQAKTRIPLPQVADIQLKPEVPKIRRFDQYRTITVQCWPAVGYLPSEIIAGAEPKLKQFQKELPNGFVFRYAGEQKDQISGFADLSVVLLICIAAIYLALLAQFKHAVKPLIVFAAIPYGAVGAILALLVMGAPFGFMAFLGIISLIGVIVSHIIVLFEFIEEKREEGEELELALIDAGILRLRPVLITVSATVFALFPLAAHGGPLWESLCYAQIGGLTVATFITLGLVPILYSIVVLDLKWVQWGDEKKDEKKNENPPHELVPVEAHPAT